MGRTIRAGASGPSYGRRSPSSGCGLGYIIATGFSPSQLRLQGNGQHDRLRCGRCSAASCSGWFQTQSDIVIGGRTLHPHELGLYAEALFLTKSSSASSSRH